MKTYSGWGWMELVLGVLLIVLGIFTIIKPGAFITVAVVFYGISALLSGIADVVFYIRAERHIGVSPTIALVAGIVSILVGVTMILYPGVGRFTMALLFPMWFIAHCTCRLANFGFIQPFFSRGFGIATQIINVAGIVFGLYLLFHPAASVQVLSWLIGLAFVTLGVDTLSLARFMKDSEW